MSLRYPELFGGNFSTSRLLMPSLHVYQQSRTTTTYRNRSQLHFLLHLILGKHL